MTLRITFIFLWCVYHQLVTTVISHSGERSIECSDPVIRVDNNGLIQSHKTFDSDLYPNNLDCDWLIKAPPSYIIMAQFNFINIEYEPQCSFDYIEFAILNGSSIRRCGNRDKERYMSSGNTLIIRFHSDKATHLEGFLLRYWFVNNHTDNFPITKFGRACVASEWECQCENSCIPKEWVCDNVRDCKDNADEATCDFRRSCHPSQISCQNGECKAKEKWCDQNLNCKDGSDEYDCTRDTRNQSAPHIPLDVHKCSFQPIKPNNINITDDNAQIVGGEEAVPGSWPWMASLRYGSSHYCGATLISRTWAVTAAHCFENSAQPEVWQLDLGRHYVNNDDHIQRISIALVVKHPQYNPGTIENDITMLKLSRNATFNSKVQPICLPEAMEGLYPSQRCIILGWGVTKGTGYQGVLKQAILPIVDYKRCSAVYTDLKESMLCAGYEEGGVDACQQDSGGPLICSNKGKLVLNGITSWGDGCALPGKPGVYTNVARYVPWIRSMVKDLDN